MAHVRICLTVIFPENIRAKYALKLCSKISKKTAVMAGIHTNKYFRRNSSLGRAIPCRFNNSGAYDRNDKTYTIEIHGKVFS